MAKCVECGLITKNGSNTWNKGEGCIFGMIFACSRKCAEEFCTANDIDFQEIDIDEDINEEFKE